jgi:hypothetical protein
VLALILLLPHFSVVRYKDPHAFNNAGALPDIVDGIEGDKTIMEL